MKEKLKRNIKVSYIYNFLLQLNITSAIWVLYLGFKGMSLIEIGVLESIYHIASVIFELPTGVIADLYGKKFSVVLGRFVSIISCILMIMSNSFLGFAASFALSAAAMNLNSGAGEALIYDSLKELGEEEKYKVLWGNLSFIMCISQGIAVLFGGILADVRFLYAYILGTIVQIAALIAAYNFNEPQVQKYDKEEIQGSLIINQLNTSVRVLKKRKIVLYLILFSALAGSLQTTVFFYSQQYFSDMNYSKTMIAVICAVSSLLEAVSSKYAYKVENKLSLRGTLISISIANIISLLGLSLSKESAIVFFFLTSITGGLAFTVLSTYINSRIPSEYRATILSFDSFSFSIFMIGVFPLFGLLAEKIGFSVTFELIGLLYIPVMILLLLKINKHKNIEEKSKETGGNENDRISFE